MTKQSIVPLKMIKTGTKHFKQRTKNERLLRSKVEAIELSFFSSLDVFQRLENVFCSLMGLNLSDLGSNYIFLWENGFTKKN